jgi:hypothetical protein
MAVPPAGAEAIATALLKCFAGVAYDSVPAAVVRGPTGGTAKTKGSAMQYVLSCQPSPGNGRKRTELVRAVLLPRIGGVGRDELARSVMELAPGTVRKEVAKVLARMSAAREISEDDGVVKLTPRGRMRTHSGAKKNPFLAEAGKEAADIHEAAAAKTGGPGVPELMEAVMRVESGLSILRRAVYEFPGEIERVLGRDRTEAMSAGLMETDRSFEAATRALRLCGSRKSAPAVEEKRLTEGKRSIKC